MSELSDNIQTTFNNMIAIYQESANLLLDASSILEKSGYQCLHGNTLGTEQSKNINNPKWWITPYISRYFAAQENPDEMKVIGIFFVDRDYVPIGPIILISCFKMQRKESEEEYAYNYWYLKEIWFSLIKERQLGVDLDFGKYRNIASGKVRGVPLVEVNNQETLKKYVVEPLISMSC
jgi:hypothetical protein